MLLVQLYAPTLGVALAMLVLGLLLLTSAFISGAEAAAFSLKPADYDDMRRDEERVQSYKLSLQMLANQNRLLATILITNNLVNIGIVILSAFITDGLFSFEDSPVLGFVVQVVLITFLILLFGEVLPKLLGTAKPLLYLQYVARPLYSLYVVLKPFSLLMAGTVSRINEHMAQRESSLSMEDLGDALEITKGQIEDQAMLKRIVDYGSIEVSEIMKPRIDAVGVDIDEDYATLKALMLESGYSRIPAYRESFDKVEGVLYIKDLLPYIDRGNDFDWVRLLRPAMFVPENKRLGALFYEFQQERIHFAVVVDEYGGTSGIVTLEDVLEEVFGEIQDESDDRERLYTRIGERAIRFEAKIQINDLCKVLGLSIHALDEVRGESETLAGLVLEQLGRFPTRGEELEVGGLKLKVVEVNKRRIEIIRVDY
ncbi:MAG: hemolysin [Bacteroidetes bacterium]|nr:MAG: hemolysin [Bacteroidota bacterium]